MIQQFKESLKNLGLDFDHRRPDCNLAGRHGADECIIGHYLDTDGSRFTILGGIVWGIDRRTPGGRRLTVV